MLRVGCLSRGSATDAPEVSAARARASPPAVPADSAGFGMTSGLLGGPITPEVHQAELPDLYLISISQQAFVDKVAVDIGAVQAAYISHHGAFRGTGEGGMPTGHRDVVQKDVRILMPSDGDHVGIQ